MSRIENLKDEELTAEQRALFATIGGTRARVGGPFPIWLRNPAICRPANELGNALRVGGKIDRRLFELMVLLVARYWSAQYEWFVHERAARAAGLADEIIAAVRERRAPASMRADEQIVYEFVTELNETKRVSAATYHQAQQELGRDGLIELVSAAGFYTMVAMTLNAFEVETPDGAVPL